MKGGIRTVDNSISQITCLNIDAGILSISKVEESTESHVATEDDNMGDITILYLAKRDLKATIWDLKRGENEIEGEYFLSTPRIG